MFPFSPQLSRTLKCVFLITFSVVVVGILYFSHLYLLLQKNCGYLKLAPTILGESDSMCSKGGLGPLLNEKII